MIDFLAGVPGKLAAIYTHLTTYLSSTRTAKIDNLDTTISSRAAASTALTNATWTDAKAGYLDMAISGVARIKSIQHIASAQSAGSDPSGVIATVTISAVTTAKTIVIFNGVSGSNSYSWGGGRLALTSTTQLSFAASRTSADSNTFTINAVVLEFY